VAALEVACDQSGSEGEPSRVRHHPCSSHASTVVGLEESTSLVSEAARRMRSTATGWWWFRHRSCLWPVPQNGKSGKAIPNKSFADLVGFAERRWRAGARTPVVQDHLAHQGICDPAVLHLARRGELVLDVDDRVTAAVADALHYVAGLLTSTYAACAVQVPVNASKSTASSRRIATVRGHATRGGLVPRHDRRCSRRGDASEQLWVPQALADCLTNEYQEIAVFDAVQPIAVIK
jgi:hypothetical protein